MIVDALLKAYYDKPSEAGSEMSSHWRHYSQQFSIHRGPDGRVQQMTGVGFGDLMVKNAISKILLTLCNVSYFVRLPWKKQMLSLLMPARRVVRAMDAFLSYDCFKQMYATCLISEGLKRINAVPRRVLVIGDGYGFLGCLLNEVWPGVQVTFVDIGRTLVFQAYNGQKVFPEHRHALAGTPQAGAADFIYCPADQSEKIHGIFDVVINIASMQEMDPAVIENYFRLIRSHVGTGNLFYCCNRESKTLRGGEHLEIRNYPWNEGDRHLVDEVCPWYAYYFSIRRWEHGPRLMGVRVPFVNYFDGATIHRLTIMKSAILAPVA